MKKANISSIITLLVILIIYSTIMITKNSSQKSINILKKEINEIRAQNNNYTLYLTSLKTNQELSFIKQTQNITKLSQITDKNFQIINKKILLEIQINYSTKQKYNKYSNNTTINITINYPILSFLQQTQNIQPLDLINCACPKINSTKCNQIFNTNLTWQEESCGIFKKHYSIQDNTTLTKILPHYLFNKTCQNLC